MSELKGACVIGQSGGPTSVINSSVLGAIETALDNPAITRVFGMAHGIKGLLNDDLYDIDKEDREELALLRYTPSSALGSCRYKLADPDVDDTDYKRILEIFKKYDIRYFFYNGGNDSMDTCNKVSKYMMKSGYECRVMGIPKTIDNDLFGTDHCPGLCFRCQVYRDPPAWRSIRTRAYTTPAWSASWRSWAVTRAGWPALLVLRPQWAQARIWFTCLRPTST